ncbi:MAG: acyl-CoA dehydrogenase family protein [Nocardiopsaceae bacterium]|jgi:alkylation response protein AidB-like acyl-CoA dehydrogenase|nr:acyl-CoA dehydrogenase family protein [Nocardiopsaceae bacterium]
MAAPELSDLDPAERDIVTVVRDWVDQEVRPVARDLEHAGAYPADLIAAMKGLGVYGLVIPHDYGGSGVSTACFALVTEELARGWMSLAGAMGGHSVIARLIERFGTQEQRDSWLPRLATGEVRATMALTEPGGGSDLQAIRTRAARDGAGYRLDGTKTWITNARTAGVTAVLCKTGQDTVPPSRGISILLAEPGPGFTVSRDLPKLGYKGVESCELSFDGYHCPAGALLGGTEGEGFRQMMDGLELGRVQVAARAVGVARAALEDSLRYAQQREAFGQPIWRHQAVGHRLADMATQVAAARLLTTRAAAALDAGRRSDLEAGMAKLFASEACLAVTADAVKVHGGYGYSAEFDIERYYRDAPLMVVGEGTNDIQRNVIIRQLIDRYPA